MSKWEPAGSVFVDSGCIMIGDPCYTAAKDCSHTAESWDDFLKRTWPKDFGNGKGPSVYDQVSIALQEKGIGVIVSSGYGDGEYPVYIKTWHDGRIAEAKVVFITEDEEDY